MAQETEKKLLAMKQKVEEAKTQSAQLQGALDQLNENLKIEFGVDTLEAAEKLLTRLEREEKDLDVQLEDVVDGLEKDYQW